MTNAGDSASWTYLANLAAAGAASLLALAIGATAGFAEDSAAETLAAGALYERVADSTRSPVPPSAASVMSAPAAAPSHTPSKTVELTDSMPAPSFAAQNSTDQSTTEIPPAFPERPPVAVPNSAVPQNSSGDSEIFDYQNSQNDPDFDPRLHSLQEFMSEGPSASPLLGIEVRQTQSKLASGQTADGLLIVDVRANSPAAKAGLRPFRRTASDVLKGIAVAGALFFPPAIILVPIVDQVHIGETSDLIIAVDGTRVTDFIQFEDQMRDVRPGEIVYLSIVREGARLQVPIQLSATLPPSLF